MSRYWSILLTLSLSLSYSHAPALWAHGCGAVRLANEEIGRYRTTICVFPEPVQTGTVHISVALSDVETNKPLLNQPVTVALDDSASIPAVHDNADNRFFHEADFELDEAGEYEITVNIADEEPVTLLITAEPAPLISVRMIAAVIATLAVGLIYFVSRK